MCDVLNWCVLDGNETGTISTFNKTNGLTAINTTGITGHGYSQVNSSWGPIRVGLYSRHLSHWLRRFPLSQFHFVHGEHLVSNPAAELQRVEQFLGVRPVISTSHFYFNSTKGFPCIQRTRSHVHCLGKTKGRTHPHIAQSTLHKLAQYFQPFNLQFYHMTGIQFGWWSTACCIILSIVLQ